MTEQTERGRQGWWTAGRVLVIGLVGVIIVLGLILNVVWAAIRARFLG